MFKKIAAVSLLAALPAVASAEWVAGLGFNMWDLDLGGASASPNSISGSIGYKFGPQGEGLKFIPEFRYGLGMGDDTVQGVDIEVDNFVALTAKGQYDFTGGGYVFALLGWSDLEANFDGPGGSESGSEDETGFGLGAGFQFNESVATELSFESYDDAEAISLAVKFHFN